MASVETEIIATQAQAALQSNNVAVAQTALSLVKSNPQVRAACIYNRDGMIFAKVSDEADFKFHSRRKLIPRRIYWKCANCISTFDR